MGTGYGEAVEGWIQLAEWWIDAWGTHVNKIATKVDGGTYTANDAAKDLVDCAYLAAETTVLVGNEVVEAAAVMSGQHNKPIIIRSDNFPALKKATSERTVALDGPLTSPLAANPIPVAAVAILPVPEPTNVTPFILPANITAFRLQVTATGFDGVGYVGTVGVFDKVSTVRIETVTVWVQVP